MKNTRKEAKEYGDSLYFTGKPCSNAHISNRYTSNAMCVNCSSEHNKSEEAKEYARNYSRLDSSRVRNRSFSKKYHEQNRVDCLQKMKVRNKIYYEKNKDKIKQQTSKYQAENTKARSDYKKQWAKDKKKIDPSFRMLLVMRRMIQRALGLSGQKKYKNTKDYLPYTSEQLKTHLESKFKDGMTWDNYGIWHIDHIMPLSLMIKNGIIEASLLNALNNLQPLWAIENMAKGNKYTYPCSGL